MSKADRTVKKTNDVLRITASRCAKSLVAIARKHRGNTAQSQRERIWEAIRTHGAVTTIEMRRDLDVLSPAPRILELRRMGKRIVTHRVKQVTDYGKVHSVALYVLES